MIVFTNKTKSGKTVQIQINHHYCW